MFRHHLKLTVCRECRENIATLLSTTKIVCVFFRFICIFIWIFSQLCWMSVIYVYIVMAASSNLFSPIIPYWNYVLPYSISFNFISISFLFLKSFTQRLSTNKAFLLAMSIFLTSITEETCIVEMRTWCKKIGIVNLIKESKNFNMMICVFLCSAVTSLSKKRGNIWRSQTCLTRLVYIRLFQIMKLLFSSCYFYLTYFSINVWSKIKAFGFVYILGLFCWLCGISYVYCCKPYDKIWLLTSLNAGCHNVWL